MFWGWTRGQRGTDWHELSSMATGLGINWSPAETTQEGLEFMARRATPGQDVYFKTREHYFAYCKALCADVPDDRLLDILRASNGWDAKQLVSRNKANGLAFTTRGMRAWDPAC